MHRLLSSWWKVCIILCHGFRYFFHKSILFSITILHVQIITSNIKIILYLSIIPLTTADTWYFAFFVLEWASLKNIWIKRSRLKSTQDSNFITSSCTHVFLHWCSSTCCSSKVQTLIVKFFMQLLDAIKHT